MVFEPTRWWHLPHRIVQTNLRLIDANLDPERLVAQACDFGATAILFNVGGIFAWYPTKLPLHAANPFLRGDLVGAVLQAAHKAGIRVIGRFDLSKATRVAYQAHPDWFFQKCDGTPVIYSDTYQACINGGWYWDHSVQMLREALSLYDLDGVFFNMFGYLKTDYSQTDLGNCNCANCQREFLTRYGAKIPGAVDYSDAIFRNYLRFQDETTREIADHIHGVVRTVRPEAAITSMFAKGDMIREEVYRAADRPAPEWAHASGEQARNARSRASEGTYSSAMTHFFDYPWRYQAESGPCEVLRLAQQLANGGQPHYYFLGTFDQPNRRPIDDVRRVFAFHARNSASYAGLVSGADIAVYHSAKAERFCPGEARAGLASSTAAYRGAYRALCESGLAFDCVSDRQLSPGELETRIARYKVLVLPDVSCLSDGEAAVIDDFVVRGGAIVATGRTGLCDEHGARRSGNALKCLPVVGLPSEMPDMRGAYVCAVNVGDRAYCPSDCEQFFLDGPYYRYETENGADRYLAILLPQRFGPPELCFTTGKPDPDLPGIIEKKSGNGWAALVPWHCDALYYRHGFQEHRHIISFLATRYAPPAPVVISGATRIELTIQKGPGHTMVHLVNFSGQSDTLYDKPVPVEGIEIGLRDIPPDATARALVAQCQLDAMQDRHDGYTWFRLPRLEAFEAVRIESLKRQAHSESPTGER
ncbi:MAG TPA: alpha-amylase family protein [Devosiaceae bacterium]